MYRPSNNKPLAIRAKPKIDGERTASHLQVDEEFYVSGQHIGGNGIRYLKLADGRGWAFEFKPGVGTMCVKKEPQWEPASAGISSWYCPCARSQWSG